MKVIDISLGADDGGPWVEINGERVPGAWWEQYRTTTEHPPGHHQVLEREIRIRYVPERERTP